MPEEIQIRRLSGADLAQMRALNALFTEVFEDPESYAKRPPPDAYLQRLLDKPHVIALAALAGGQVVGGLVGYELEKFEQARSEIYIYDLGVAVSHRRRGIAAGLIGCVQEIARDRGAWVIFVLADYGDDPATALYDKLGAREAVLHFDIPPAGG